MRTAHVTMSSRHANPAGGWLTPSHLTDPEVSGLVEQTLGAVPDPAAELAEELLGPATSIPCDALAGPAGLELRFDLPGVAADDVAVTVDGHILTVAAARVPAAGTGRVILAERPSGACCRSFAVDDRYDLDLLSAHLDCGELTVVVPHRPTAFARNIVVTDGPRPAPDWAAPDRGRSLEDFLSDLEGYGDSLDDDLVGASP